MLTRCTLPQIEFFAEDELVTIVPNFSFETVNSMLLGLEVCCMYWPLSTCTVIHTQQGVRYGPFRPNTATDVPLWLAIALKRRNRCEILKPMWLEVEVLEGARCGCAPTSHRHVQQTQKCLKRRNQTAPSFSRCRRTTSRSPSCCFDTPRAPSRMTCARQGTTVSNNIHALENPTSQTKELVDSIIKRRMHKLELGMSELEGPVTVKLNNLSVMELNTIRPFFQIALQRFSEYAQVCRGVLAFINAHTCTTTASKHHGGEWQQHVWEQRNGQHAHHRPDPSSAPLAAMKAWLSFWHPNYSTLQPSTYSVGSHRGIVSPPACNRAAQQRDLLYMLCMPNHAGR